MLSYFIKRLAQSLITLLLIITLVFLLLRLMPEDGYLGDRGDKMDAGTREAVLKSMGLRDPVAAQLLNFYKSLLHGDLGKSITYRRNVPITEIIAAKIPFSLKLGMSSLIFSLLLGIPLGVTMAKSRESKGKFADKGGTAFIVFVNAVPEVIYYIIIQVYITGLLGLPTLFGPDEPVTWVLPVLSLSLPNIAYYAMWMRRYMVDEMNRDYVMLARAKGQTERKIMFGHIFRNSFVPMAQYIPSAVLFTVAGSIYIESLYSIPGMGGLLIQAVRMQDNPLVQALVLIFSSFGVFGLVLGDIAMVIADPRIKFDKRTEAR